MRTGTGICKTCQATFAWSLPHRGRPPLFCAEHRGRQLHRRAYFKEYARAPEVKARRKAWRAEHYAKPENRARLRAAVRARHALPEVKHRRKVVKLARLEARERGVPTEVVRSEWRV